MIPLTTTPVMHLNSANVVVSAARAGTATSALAAGLPMVLRPLHADQPENSERAVAAGVAIAIVKPEEERAAVTAILSTPAYRSAAQAVAADIAKLDPPARALRLLLDRVGSS